MKCHFTHRIQNNSSNIEVIISTGAPEPNSVGANIPAENLPRCGCGGLLRPHVVWFGEQLDSKVLGR